MDLSDGSKDLELAGSPWRPVPVLPFVQVNVVVMKLQPLLRSKHTFYFFLVFWSFSYSIEDLTLDSSVLTKNTSF